MLPHEWFVSNAVLTQVRYQNYDQLIKITKVLGTDEFWQYLDKVIPLHHDRPPLEKI